MEEHLQGSIPKKWDVFISHAYEDKEPFVKRLTKALQAFGVNVWYDDFSLKIGDSLSKAIDHGLKDSTYAIVVISTSFLEKGWTDYEYRSLLSREVGFKKVILPIWHNITKLQVQSYSGYLADKFALDTERFSLREIVTKLLEIIRPDIYNNLSRHLYYTKIVRKGKRKTVKMSSIQKGPVLHKSLPQTLVNRIRIIHYLTNDYLFSDTLDAALDNFKRDMNPTREVQIWEIIVGTFLEFTKKYQIERHEVLVDILDHLLGFSVGSVKETTFLTEDALDELFRTWKQNYSPITFENNTNIT